MTPNQAIKDILNSEKIEYFCILPVSEVQIINQRLLPQNVKTAIAFLIPYRTDRGPSLQLAHFAKVRDYHAFSKELFERTLPRLKACFPENQFYGFADHSPVNERKLAAKGGLGDIGDNGLLINEKYGSFVFIGEILTDAFFETSTYTEKRLCYHCGKCQASCPKDIANGRCISEVSQQKRKTEKDFFLLRQTNTIWGCDKCQDVCPLNRSVELSPIEYFFRDIISSPEDILMMNEKTFEKYPFAYRGRQTITENIKNILKKDID